MAPLKYSQISQTLGVALTSDESLLLRNLLAETRNDRRSVRPSAKIVPTAAISVRAFRTLCAVILMFAAAPLVLCAEEGKKDPCTGDLAATSPAKDTPATIEDQTKAALAKEWKTANGANELLKALDLLTASVDLHSEPRNKVNKEVLTHLINGDPNVDKKDDPNDEHLYRSAMGNPDKRGRPRVPPPVNLLDTLSKANTLTKPTDEDQKTLYHAQLFTCTQKLINNMSPPNLVDINYSFGQKNDHNYVALYQLLKACPGDKQPDYLGNLEILRAAFEDDSDLLAKKVAARISAKK
jgi:hypothetical protein